MKGKSVSYAVLAALISLATVFGVLSVYLGDASVMVVFVCLSGAILTIEPFGGVLVLVVLMTLRPHAFVPGLRGMPLVLIVGSATFVSMVLHAAVARGQMFGLTRTPHDRIMLWFFSSLLLSHIANLDLGSAVNAAREFAPVLIVYFCIVNLVTTERRLESVFDAVVLSSVGLALLGFGQQVGILNLPGVGGEFENRMVSVGIARDPNIFALTLLAAVPLTVKKVSEGSWLNRLGSWGLLIVLIVAIYLTNSRGAAVSLVLTATVFVVLRYGALRGLVVGSILLVVMVFLGPSRFGEMEATSIGEEPRLMLWQAGLETFVKHPVFGIGAFSWFGATGRMVPHNSFIHCAGELGLFGLFPWVLLIFVSARSLLQLARAAGDGRAVSPANARALFYSLVAFGIGAQFLSETYYYLLYVQIGLASSLATINLGDGDAIGLRLDRRDWLYGAMLMAGILLSFEILVKVFGYG